MENLICGAKTRSNSCLPCKLKPLANGRCRFHGGLTPKKHGQFTKAAIQERRRIRKLIQESQKYIYYLNSSNL